MTRDWMFLGMYIARTRMTATISDGQQTAEDGHGADSGEVMNKKQRTDSCGFGEQTV